MLITSTNFAFIATEENYNKLSALPINIRKPLKGTFKSAVNEFQVARSYMSQEHLDTNLKIKFTQDAVKNAVKKLQCVVNQAEKNGVKIY